jgi:hypothetical protein
VVAGILDIPVGAVGAVESLVQESVEFVEPCAGGGVVVAVRRLHMVRIVEIS